MAGIIERNGSYRITVYYGLDKDGKRKRYTTTFTPESGLTPKRRLRAAEDFARKFEEQIQNSDVVQAGRTTLKEFAERWLDEYAPQNLQIGTIEDYKDELDSKILPVLGHLKLSDLKPVKLNSVFSAMAKDGARKDGKKGGYSALRDAIERYNTDVTTELKLPLIPFHGLRHTSATLLIAGKQDAKTVAARLGHAQTSTTMNIYVHALKENDQIAVDAIEDVLAKHA